MSCAQQPRQVHDVAIVGGGLAGSLVATLLAQAGRNVALVDLHPSYPPDFRAEQVVGEQVEQLDRLGLRNALLSGLTEVDRAVIGAHGHVLGRVDAPHYGIRYEHLVQRARQLIPPSVPVVSGRVVAVETSFDWQEVVLADDRCITARLVVLAGGLQLSLLRKLGFHHRRIRDAHSLTFGFDLESAEPGGFPYPVTVYHAAAAAKGIDYLTVFPLDEVMRANLFTFRDVRDPWAKSFRETPEPKLAEVLPGLNRVLGKFRITGQVATRVVDLYAVSDPIRDGLVLIGDAFQTSCPAAGTGISRLLTEIECLCGTHMPVWLASAGMAAEKIATFYADPRKRAMDAEAERSAHYRRELAWDRSLNRRLHRAQLYLRRRIGGLLGGPQRLTTGLRPLHGAATNGEVAATMPVGAMPPFTPPKPAKNQLAGG